MILFLIAVVQAAPQSPAGSAASPAPVPVPSAEAVAHDTGLLRHASGRTPPVAAAARATQAPVIDGRLDDGAWQLAVPVTAFYQRRPTEGAEATERSEVRIVYDDDAIYIAARLFDSDPARIKTELSRRDNLSASDEFTVAFDSYHDHRTAFVFTVNPSGVREDRTSGADGQFGDGSWDPVWEARAQVDSLGWTAELRIPLSQLRFSPATEQVWGLHLSRLIHRKAETADFAWRPNTDAGFASHFGHLFGLSGLPQPRRLEVLPYLTSSQRFDRAETGNPFRDGSHTTADVGADFKYGVTSNLTLDATINPDFGQVEQDPAFVNLSAFEQFLAERRPFFIEGTEIFRFQGNQFFYSRRIGRPPRGSAGGAGEYVDRPEQGTILGAAKLTGRTSSGWSLGLLEAMTQREFATVADAGTGARRAVEVEPLTNYLAGRVRRDLRGGATQLGGMFTAVHRDIRRDLSFLRRAAYAGGADVSHRFSRNRFRLTASAAGSHIRGDPLAIELAQLSSARYFQRPDARYVEFDPARTTLSGWSGRLQLSRVQGNLTWNLSANATSPGFEINDAGFQTRGDNRNLNANVQRSWTRPGRFGRSGYWGGDMGRNWNFGGVPTGMFVGSYFGIEFLNYWEINGSVGINPRHNYDDVLTRGGPLGYRAPSINWFLGINSDSRKALSVFLGSFYFTSALGSWESGVFSELELRPSSNINIEIEPEIFRSESVQQYLMAQNDPLATATYGTQYVVAEIHQRSMDLTTRLNLTFSPSLSLQLYAQPFIATGDYTRFKELAEPGTANYIVYGSTAGSTLRDSIATDGTRIHIGDPDGAGPRPEVIIRNPDFNSRSLRGNAVLRWEYRPGSTMFFVWTQSCGAGSSNPRFAPGEDFRHLCQGRSLNAFAVKLNWWLSL